MKVFSLVLIAFVVGLTAGYYQWGRSEPTASVEPVLKEMIRETPPPVGRELSEFEGLIVVAETLIQQGDYRASVDVLLEADIAAASSVEQEAVVYRLREAVNGRVGELQQLGLLDEIDRLYESLTLSMPEQAEYYILLAEHRIEMNNRELALPVLAQIENHHQLGGRARELIRQINAPLEPQPLANIPLIRVGDQFLVDAEIDNETTTRLLLDTGASMTILDPDLLLRLGYTLDGPRTGFNTAGGRVRAPVVEISSLALAGVSLYPMMVGALELEGRVGGLLGMDFLRRFEFQIDQDQGLLVIIDQRAQ